MEKVSYEPLTYTNVLNDKGRRLFYVIFSVCVMMAIFFLVLGIYLVAIDPNVWGLLFLFIFMAVAMGIVASFFYPKRRQVYHYELNDSGLHQYWENTKTGETYEVHFLFEDIDEVIIGIAANRVHVPKRRDFYRFDGQLIISSQGRYFMERVYSSEQLNEWVIRLKNHVPNITYTEANLLEALEARAYTEIDFSRIQGTSDDVVSKHIGKESVRNLFASWLPEDMEEKAQAEKEKQLRANTKKAEKQTYLSLLVFSIFMGLFLLPNAPVDEDNFIEITDRILIVYGIYLFIPVILLFFRSYTKWYNPLLCCLVTAFGLGIGMTVAAFVVEIPSFGSIVMLGALSLLFWILAYVVAKLFKVIANFMYKHNL
ncbi:hypothetical protein SAMN05216389_103140 [Oceanobacillus limi]|uniref:Uncharacterized protein n=1 Tax=Oceanobacillus limi TaxID=930131 RepID=A0A1I0A9M4_9BACI|nr:hypothetical protein [Oceanobacillus limi]SES90882.1 hypothetical protein SAMN05216389_103140 [Oceanobacillus limi]